MLRCSWNYTAVDSHTDLAVSKNWVVDSQICSWQLFNGCWSGNIYIAYLDPTDQLCPTETADSWQKVSRCMKDREDWYASMTSSTDIEPLL